MSPNAIIPRHVAIIMDGNGRWAEARGLPRIEGHRRGADSVRVVTRVARELGVERLTLYAFSEQNWGRARLEVRGLMRLLRDYLRGERDELMNNGIRLRTIGRTEKLPAFVRYPLRRLKDVSAKNRAMELYLALSYGGREELTEAVRRIAKRVAEGDLDPDRIDEGLITSELAAKDADLVIRTSGEQRLSNFLLWESAYAEFYFTDRLWPDFGRADFLDAIADYNARNRRFGLATPKADKVRSHGDSDSDGLDTRGGRDCAADPGATLGDRDIGGDRGPSGR